MQDIAIPLSECLVKGYRSISNASFQILESSIGDTGIKHWRHWNKHRFHRHCPADGIRNEFVRRKLKNHKTPAVLLAWQGF